MARHSRVVLDADRREDAAAANAKPARVIPGMRITTRLPAPIGCQRAKPRTRPGPAQPRLRGTKVWLMLGLSSRAVKRHPGDLRVRTFARGRARMPWVGQKFLSVIHWVGQTFLSVNGPQGHLHGDLDLRSSDRQECLSCHPGQCLHPAGDLTPAGTIPPMPPDPLLTRAMPTRPGVHPERDLPLQPKTGSIRFDT